MQRLVIALLVIACILGCRETPGEGGSDGFPLLDRLEISGSKPSEPGFFHLVSNIEDILGPVDTKGVPVVALMDDPLQGERTDERFTLYDNVSPILNRHFGTWPVPVICFMDRNPMYSSITAEEWAAAAVEPRAISDQTVAERAGWSGATHVLRFTMGFVDGEDRIVLRMLAVPGGETLREEVLPASAEFAVTYPAAQRRLLVAAGAKLPPELAATYSDGIIGDAETFSRLLEGSKGQKPEAEILAARKQAYQEAPGSPFYRTQLLRMTAGQPDLSPEGLAKMLEDPAQAQSVGGTLRLADQLSGMKESAKAEIAYRAIFDDRASVIRAGVGLPFFLVQQNRVREAIPLMEVAARDIPSRRYRMRILGEFFTDASIALQAGRYPAEMSPGDRELLGKLSTAALAAHSLSHELSPLDGPANHEYFVALMRGGGVPLRTALPLAERAIERAISADFLMEVLSSACNYSLPQWNNDADAVAPLLWKYRSRMTDAQAEWFYDSYLAFQVMSASAATFSAPRYLAAQHSRPDAAGLLLTYADAALAQRPLNLDHRFMAYAAMEAAAGRDSDILDPLDIPKGSTSALGMKPGTVRFLLSEILHRSGDTARADEQFKLAQQEGIDPGMEWRVELALAMQKARAGDMSEILRIVPDPAEQNPGQFNRRVAALLMGDDAQRKQALDETRAAIRRTRHPLVEDAYYSALLANGEAQAVIDDITETCTGMEALPIPSRHFWREAAKTTGAGAWPPAK